MRRNFWFRTQARGSRRSGSSSDNLAQGRSLICVLTRPSFHLLCTAADHYGDTADTPSDVHLRHIKSEEEMAWSQARFLELSSNAKQTFAYQSGSACIQFDQPDLVIGAIHEVYEQSKLAGNSAR